MNIYDVPTEAKEQEITYKRADGIELKLYFLPPHKKLFEKAPIYFMFGGGGWSKQNNKSMWKYFSHISSEILRQNGFAVASADYRTTSVCSVSMPQIISDCFDAVCYTAHFADVFEIDEQKFVFSGHSAGGHLALMMAYGDKQQFDKTYPFANERFGTFAAAPLAPITHFYDIDGISPITFPPAPFPNGKEDENLALCSPYNHIKKGGPPTMLVVGTHDPLVNHLATRQFYNKLLENKINARLVEAKNAGHCFEPMVEGEASCPDYDEIQKIVADFVLEVLQKH